MLDTQPREPRSQRFAGRSHSAPEVHLAEGFADDGQPTAPIPETLANITTLFDHVSRITARGKEFYDHPDDVARYALAFALIHLGEEAKRLGRTFMVHHPGPAYRSMARQRDYLAHHFASIDWDFLWRTATSAVPASAAAHASVERKVSARDSANRGVPHLE